MKKDNDKENTIVFSKISSAEADNIKDNDDGDLTRTREIKHIKNLQEDPEREERNKKSAPPRKKKKSSADEEHTIDMSDIRARRKRQKAFRRLKKLIAPVIIIALGVSIYLTRAMWIPKMEGILDRHNGTIVNDGVTQTGNFPIKMGQSATNIITLMDNNVIAADDGHIYFYDVNGKLRDTAYHNFGNPVLRTAKKRLLAFDNGGYTFKVYGKSGELYEKTIEDQIIYADISPDGSVATVTQTDKYTACLTVYDSSGAEIYRWSCGDRIMDVSFDSSGDSCYVSVFSSDGGEIVSQIHHVRFDSTEELMVSEKMDSLVLKVCRNDNDRLWAVGDRKLYLLDKNGGVIGSYEYPNDMVSFAVNEQCVSVITSGDARETLEIAMFSSEDDGVLPVVIGSDAGNPKKTLCYGDKIFVLSSDTMDCYDRGGSLLATADVSSDYTDFVFYDESVFFMGRREINKILFNT